MRNMKQTSIYIMIGGIIIIGLLLFIGIDRGDGTDNEGSPTPTITVTPTATPTATGGEQEAIIDENWTTYTSNAVGFSMEYPETMEINEPPTGGVVFSYWGPTQEEATELFDGISMTITRERLPERFENLKAFAESKLEEERQNSEVEIIEALEPVTINGIEGYAFTAESLGIFRNIILEHSSGVTLYITYLSPDPDNRGYDHVVSRMLSTLETQ